MKATGTPGMLTMSFEFGGTLVDLVWPVLSYLEIEVTVSAEKKRRAQKKSLLEVFFIYRVPECDQM